jgi:hypothetical protein
MSLGLRAISTAMGAEAAARLIEPRAETNARRAGTLGGATGRWLPV